MSLAPQEARPTPSRGLTRPARCGRSNRRVCVASVRPASLLPPRRALADFFSASDATSSSAAAASFTTAPSSHDRRQVVGVLFIYRRPEMIDPKAGVKDVGEPPNVGTEN
ncbi:TATA box-binding protein-like 1 isoform X9 [Rattus norvegicus]|uniref:TATA box-binding protein-like 1 isoform X9 n=1 Tax=Rattus norvegicus TaxID=10116 RepID=UPI002FD84D8D